MYERQEMLCDLWPEEQVERKPHSRLYSLEPIGMGSPMVESLTSYLARLADAHSVHLYKLFLQEILPYLGTIKEDYTVPKYLTGFWRNGPALNGVGTLARDFVDTIEQLTLRSNLRFLTMLIWANVLPAQGLMRPKRAWCPSCYEEWRISGQVIYDPLLWALEVVTICPRHLQRLQMFCPYPDCQQAQFHFASKYQPGWCIRCCRWFGDFALQRIERQPSLENEEIAYQGWIYRMMGEMFSSAPNQSIFPQRSNVTTIFIHCVDNLTEGNLLAFSERMEVAFKPVWSWTRGQHIPTLRSLLNVCFRCGISPLSFITGDKNQIKFSQINAGFKVTSTCSAKHQFRKINLEYLQNALESILQNPETPPPSMRKVAERLGYALITLQRRCPAHCKAISARYLHFQSQKRQVSIRRHCEEVRQAVLILHARECYPSLRQVRKFLRNSSILKDPNVHDAWREMLKELGYK